MERPSDGGLGRGRREVAGLNRILKIRLLVRAVAERFVGGRDFYGHAIPFVFSPKRFAGKVLSVVIPNAESAPRRKVRNLFLRRKRAKNQVLAVAVSMGRL
jgi:hypothetical protein